MKPVVSVTNIQVGTISGTISKNITCYRFGLKQYYVICMKWNGKGGYGNINMAQEIILVGFLFLSILICAKECWVFNELKCGFKDKMNSVNVKAETQYTIVFKINKVIILFEFFPHMKQVGH